MENNNEPVRLHAIIHGRVQGVGFRYFVLNASRPHNVTGWTRNRINRTVEVVAEGKREDLENFLKELHQGPPASQVTKIDIEWLPTTGEFDNFQVRMTR